MRDTGAGCQAREHLVTIALQEGRCISKGIYGNLNGALF